MNKTLKADSQLANVAGADTRLKAFRAWGAADGAAGVALVACYIACAETGQTDADELGKARPDLPQASRTAYASAFNRATKVANVIGIGPAVQLIRDAVKGATGRAREAIADALGAALADAKRRDVKQATKVQAKAIAREALVKAAEKAAERTAVKAHAREPRQPKAAQLGAKAAEAAVIATPRAVHASVQLCRATAERIAAPEGREAQWRDALAKLSDACEALAAFK